jgi:hypothetical protein
MRLTNVSNGSESNAEIILALRKLGRQTIHGRRNCAWGYCRWQPNDHRTGALYSSDTYWYQCGDPRLRHLPR